MTYFGLSKSQNETIELNHLKTFLKLKRIQEFRIIKLVKQELSKSYLLCIFLMEITF